jgi:hypothetical protein
MVWDPHTWVPHHCEWGLWEGCDGVVVLSFSFQIMDLKRVKK